jgi:lantibiotic leader peptide-processing serine protease
MRKLLFIALAVAGLAAALVPGVARAARAQAQPNTYVVLYGSDASVASARMAVRMAGGTIVRENADVGVATVSSLNQSFLSDAARQQALAGVARNAPVGMDAPAQRGSKDDVERLTAAERRDARSAASPRAAVAADPLAGLQWDMAMIHATAAGSYARQPGDRRVLVGILDTGVDGTHPDIAPNFDASLSRNFTTDIPLIDGPCADEPDQSCNDPANVDEDGHGTHVAGIIGAALNGIGIAGVAPNVTLVNIRAGQDSGFFFLQSTVDALTYAANNGVDVVNMSYFIDPWLYNCAANPADSAEAQLEQRTIVAATNRALDYANRHGVTLIAALGNENTDLGNPTVDDTSPDFPPNTEYTRAVDNSCLDMPTEGHNVIAVGAVGPSTMKADYSNWGTERTDVTAPGGYFRDFFGTPQFRTVENLVLSAYPQSVAIANGDLNPDGTPNNPFVVRDCANGTCAYYQYLQGTSMAAPHAVGVAALIVSQFGVQAGPLGFTFPPAAVRNFLERTATDHACPTPPLISYANVGRGPEFDALCTGNARFNSIWGNGIVDALNAVTLNGALGH